MNTIQVFPIGKIENANGNTRIVLQNEYAAGLKELAGYSHVLVLWWMDGCDNARDRSAMIERKPYVKGSEEMGVFATRSPRRPNPIAVTSVEIAYVDEASAAIGTYYIDAFDGSAVLDIKPYTPSIDRIESPSVPQWCAHWPKSYEESGDFDWGSEFNF